jgi:CheY-like chemotaxis protein
MKTIRVLLAEDEETTRELVERQLSGFEGLICDSVGDGAAALRLLGLRRYDLAILDQFMPGLNGDEIVRSVRAVNPDLPLLALTADADQAEPLRRAGFSRVFVKPLRNADLKEILFEYTS